MSMREYLPFRNHLNLVSAYQEEALAKKGRCFRNERAVQKADKNVSLC
jgi:hypothetical protein